MVENVQLLAQLTVFGARILFVTIILVLLLVISKRKELKPDCEKGFLNGYMIYLGSVLFHRIIYYSMQLINDHVLMPQGYDIYDFPYFLFLVSIEFINQSLFLINNIILFYYIEKKLFYKKTKLKSFIVAILFQSLVYILNIIALFLSYLILRNMYNYMNFLKYLLVIGIINNSLMIIIGIIFIALFILTTKEKPETRKYSILLSIGIVLIFIITPFISYGISMINYLDSKGAYEAEFYFFYNSPYSTVIAILNLSYSFLFGIGLIIFTIGAYKTTQVPLIFAKKKDTRTEKILKKYQYDLAPEPFKEQD